ncbi:MAG: DUF4124 domain-containing protein [Burkholderiaceae bacterium]|jgi:hypothetical protein|nr:DUF4124 domain-containing protein [Burkholderiaceae bacterium]
MPASIHAHRTTVRARTRVPAAALAVLVVALAGVDAASAINRCEGRDGRVTYTDEACPATVRSARKVDDSPPVQARSAPVREASESKDAKDGKAEPKEAEGKAAVAGGVDAAKGVAVPALQAGRTTTSSNPEQEMQRLDELRERQRRQCAEATRRIDYATKDLQAAVGADRASAELALRRAQEEARGVCPPR